MGEKHNHIDRLFFITTILLLLVGFFVFSSASLGLLARENASYTLVVLKQIGVIGIGLVALLGTMKIPYTLWKKYAFALLIVSLVVTALVFVPNLGFGHNGAVRWISLGFTTFQPAELLKIAAVIYMAAWFAKYKDKIQTFNYGLLPFTILTGIIAILLLKQPDTGTFAVIFASLLSMYIIAGAHWKHLAIIITVAVLGLGIIIFTRPYVMSRITTFLNPENDSLGAGYQIQQALIAIGSGGAWGKGFGQSIQKFNFLPEPIGDSIFAVAAEEFGFLGISIILTLFIFFALRAFKISSNAGTVFGGLAASGLVILILAGTFMNITSMLGLMPLTGVPLSFISHGGTALLFNLVAVGIILNISRTIKQS